jgi:hypothetical protein
MTTSAAMKHITDEIKNNPDYRYAWQANIAVPFQDAYRDWLETHEGNPDKSDVHEISNKAADYFLNILCK